MADFPFLRVDDCRRIFSSELHKHHYNSVHKSLCMAIAGKSIENVENEEDEVAAEAAEVLARALAGEALTQTSKTRLVEIGVKPLKKSRKKQAAVIDINDPILAEEVQYVKAKQKEVQEQIAQIMTMLALREEAENNGTAIECQCCYGDYAFEEMCQCGEGHLFCLGCLRRYAQEQLFGMNKTVLNCMSEGDDGKPCQGGFDDYTMKRALSKKVMAKLEEAIFQKAVESAGLDEIARCPKCDFQCILPKTEKILMCPAMGCYYHSCRDCGEPPHVPLRCEEVEKESQVKGRKAVEEAMTEARVRECPNCGKRFYKTEGCNKRTCACKTIICYVCRQEIKKEVGYKHFCQKPHCKHLDKKKCDGCPLFTNSAEDDILAMEEAGRKALMDNEEVLAKAGAEGAVDLDKLLEKGNKQQIERERRGIELAQQAAGQGVGAMARAMYDVAPIQYR